MAIPKESKKEYYTYAEYKNWPPDEKWEIIDGEAFDMSKDACPSSKRSARPGPAHGMTHQIFSGEIFRQISNYLEDKPCGLFSAPFDVSPDFKLNLLKVFGPDVQVTEPSPKNIFERYPSYQNTHPIFK